MDPFVVISLGKKVFRTCVIRHSTRPGTRNFFSMFVDTKRLSRFNSQSSTVTNLLRLSSPFGTFLSQLVIFLLIISQSQISTIWRPAAITFLVPVSQTIQYRWYQHNVTSRTYLYARLTRVHSYSLNCLVLFHAPFRQESPSSFWVLRQLTLMTTVWPSRPTHISLRPNNSTKTPIHVLMTQRSSTGPSPVGTPTGVYVRLGIRLLYKGVTSRMEGGRGMFFFCLSFWYWLISS